MLQQPNHMKALHIHQATDYMEYILMIIVCIFKNSFQLISIHASRIHSFIDIMIYSFKYFKLEVASFPALENGIQILEKQRPLERWHRL